MRKDWKYIAFTSILIIAYLVVQLTGKKKHSWYLSLDQKDKNPYGAFVLNKLLPELFPGGVYITNKTLYEMRDSIEVTDNIFILARNFEPGKEDVNALLNLANNGASILISAETFGYTLRDTLQFESFFNFFSDGTIDKTDSSYLKFTNPSLDSTRHFYFQTFSIQRNFVDFKKDSAFTFAVSGNGNTVSLRMPWGKGNIYLNCTPGAFTNIYALSGDNHKFISGSLSVLKPTKMYWFETYQVGKREAQTPLRYILSTEPLAWAYYLVIGSLVLFIFFEGKRKQRPIPLIPPLPNDTLDFVGTISNLYYQRGDHKNIAEKRILFFYDYVKTNFYLNSHEKDFAERLSKKTNHSLQEIQSLLSTFSHCLNSVSITSDRLLDLNMKLEKFYTDRKK